MDSNNKTHTEPISSQNLCFSIPAIHFVSSIDSQQFSLLCWALNRSCLVGLDAEWKPSQTHNSNCFPRVSILQIACRIRTDVDTAEVDVDAHANSRNDSLVFLLDLLSLPLCSVLELLKDLFVSPDILKLGFRFKQDLIYLSSTFCSQGCDPGFDKMEPFLDITNIYHLLKNSFGGKTLPKETKSLATICKEVLGIRLSKELQCSDWSCRPLTEEQKSYAAADAYCLLEIFTVFQRKFLRNEGNSLPDISELHSSIVFLGLKEILMNKDVHHNVLRPKFCQASDMIKSTFEILSRKRAVQTSTICPSLRKTLPLDDSLSKIVRTYGERILLKESDRKPATTRQKGRRRSSLVIAEHKEEWLEKYCDWQGPPPWDSSLGGDGCAKFLCDVMVEGLAKQLRCVGIDAAIPSSKKPEPRQLIDQAHREKRVLLTRDAKLLRRQYLFRNQVYRVKNLAKNDQLIEVIEAFQLKICEEHLMSRCIKCNGRFIQKPLTTDEAIEAAKGFQVIPDCIRHHQNFDFWQCSDCKQIYWEGTQYHNAVQKFMTLCKLDE